MIRCRCIGHGPPPGRRRNYGTPPLLPVGYPNDAVICCLAGCNERAVAWPDDDDRAAYVQGERVFNTIGPGVRIRVQ